MAFYIKRKESVKKAVRRIAGEQIEKAIKEIDDPELGHHETVHQVRKRCKKLRGLIRLVRPCFEETYQIENAAFRDAAKSLSNIRDAQTIIDTVESLEVYFEDELDHTALKPTKTALVTRRQQLTEIERDLENELICFRQRMVDAGKRSEGWQLDEKGFNAIAGGLSKTYRRGKQAMQLAFASPSSDHFHEWRKRAKYHHYHLRILKKLWPALFDVYQSSSQQLADYLGDDHDLAVLHRTVLEKPEEFGSEEASKLLPGMILPRQSELRQDAEILGHRLYSEKPKHLSRRFRHYWQARKLPKKKSVFKPTVMD